MPVSREEFSTNYNVQSYSSSHITQTREEHRYSYGSHQGDAVNNYNNGQVIEASNHADQQGEKEYRRDDHHCDTVNIYNDQARGASHGADQLRREEQSYNYSYGSQHNREEDKQRETVSHYSDQAIEDTKDVDKRIDKSFRAYDWGHKGEAQSNKDIVIKHVRKSESPTSSISTDMTEAIDFALNQISVNHTFSREIKKQLNDYQNKFVLLGNQDTMNAMWNTLRRQGVIDQDILTCPISPEGDMLQYEDLLRRLTVGDQVVFVWAIKTESGNVDDDFIMVFKDFLDIFAADAIKSMAVVLWYPGSIEEIRGSIEDLTERVKQKYQYSSPLGFPVLQYTSDTYFEAKVVETMLGMQPFKITNITLSKPEPLLEQDLTNTLRGVGMVKEDRLISKSQEIVVVSTDHVTENTQDGEEEERVDHETLVETPVVLLVGAPGHGKSSVGNLILGGDHFQVRGNNVMESQTIIKSGYLVRNEAYTTVLESPGFYKERLEKPARMKVEKEIRKIGFLTHIVIVWHALELRDDDLDFVLEEVLKLFGEKAVEHIIFTVTYCDTGSKAKKYRSKRGISYDSICAMISRKAQKVFQCDEKPLIYFLCSKHYKDQSRKHLIQYLNYDQWKMLPANRMANWTYDLDINPDQKENYEDNYEEVEEEVFFPDNSLPSGSKSLHNLSTLTSTNNLSRDNDDVSKSLHTVHVDDLPQDDQHGRNGRGRLFSSNVGKRSSTSGSNIGKRTLPGRASRGRGRSRSQFGGQTRSRSNSGTNLERKEESVQNVYNESSKANREEVDDRTLTRDRSSSRKRNQSRSGLFGTMARSRSRSNVRKSRANLAVNDPGLNANETKEFCQEVQESNDADNRDGTLVRGQYTRQRSGGSVTSSAGRRRGRSKSRERTRTRQSRSQLRGGRQSTSLPRSQQEAGDRRPAMRRSRSSYSLKSSGNRNRARRDGDCTIL